MNSAEIEKITKAWVAHTHEFNINENTELGIWASDKMWDLADEEPEICWLVIQEILRQDSSTTILENLSAGPLEDLLSKHGLQFISRIETEAKNNPKFAILLGGVWQNDMSEEIWKRVQGVWNRRGWDGNSG